ncbi:MAG TPA: hypothetical protein VFS56_03950 [Gemmatimonadaceae bacterium]|nr:hypothetical protein [Gemmatimonadaceae bacterium]
MSRHIRMKKALLAGFFGVTLAAVPGCEIENPTAVTEDNADPVMLLRGARSKFSDAMGIIGSAFVASDEGLAKSSFQTEDQTGDISGSGAYTTWYSQVHQARRLAEFAIERADALDQAEVGLLAHVWHGWTHIRLAELWGAQPFDGGPVLTADEILTRALADLEAGTAAAADSTRHRAFAGVARINYIRGRSTPVNNAQLTAAIAAAQTVLSQNPRFMWVELPNFNPLNFAFGRSYGPTPFYRDIPLWFAGFPQFGGHDATLTFNDQTKPQGVVVIDADELRLIQAHSHLLLGDLAAAKAAFKTVALLPINHVRVCRQPQDPPMTAAEIAACVDPMTESELATAIDGLQRENQYLSARRPVKEDGAPIMPFAIPPNA